MTAHLTFPTRERGEVVELFLFEVLVDGGDQADVIAGRCEYVLTDIRELIRR